MVSAFNEASTRKLEKEREGRRGQSVDAILEEKCGFIYILSCNFASLCYSLVSKNINIQFSRCLLDRD